MPGALIKIAEKEKLPRVVSVQNPYSLINRTYEIGMSEISMRENAGLLAYSPLGIGYLTGKYRNKQIPKNSRSVDSEALGRRNLFGRGARVIGSRNFSRLKPNYTVPHPSKRPNYAAIAR